MPYATGRVFHDADSHIMETPDWLDAHADPAVRPKLKPRLQQLEQLLMSAALRMRPCSGSLTRRQPKPLKPLPRHLKTCERTMPLLLVRMRVPSSSGSKWRNCSRKSLT